MHQGKTERQEMKHPSNRELFEYWNMLRGERLAPERADIEPSAIRTILGDTFVLERDGWKDPVFRLAGVNRALEGLAIDVFTTMRDFADQMGDPILRFCEDWMLADEVTHVKMGSNWLRQLTESDADRRARALEFQRTVDSLFNFRGLRGEGEESSIKLARRFREMAGFSTEEIDEISDMAKAQRAEAMAAKAAAVSR